MEIRCFLLIVIHRDNVRCVWIEYNGPNRIHSASKNSVDKNAKECAIMTYIMATHSFGREIFVGISHRKMSLSSHSTLSASARILHTIANISVYTARWWSASLPLHQLVQFVYLLYSTLCRVLTKLYFMLFSTVVKFAVEGFITRWFTTTGAKNELVHITAVISLLHFQYSAVGVIEGWLKVTFRQRGQNII